MKKRTHAQLTLVTLALLVLPVATRVEAVVITEYSIPTANAQPIGIAAGPDGNVWFVVIGQPNRTH